LMLKRFVPTTTALVAAPFMLAFYVPLIQESLLLTVWVIAVTKFTDVGGLLTGMWIGKHKLAPAFSPKKTWEGAVGGVLAAVLVGCLIHLFGTQWMPDRFTLGVAVIIAPVLAVVGICADLFESAWKREVGIKDSGSLFPGIGGAFDLTDSLLFAAPAMVILLSVLT
jgi:phosphatidate cytidylyltransferase